MSIVSHRIFLWRAIRDQERREEARANRAQDARVREVLDEARAKRDLGLERRGEKLRTLGWKGRKPSPLPRLDDAA